jgi:hypothetical protein
MKFLREYSMFKPPQNCGNSEKSKADRHCLQSGKQTEGTQLHDAAPGVVARMSATDEY